MEPFIAQIVMFAGNFAPRGWAFCDGQVLAISSNSALFSIIGTIYGGDGRTTFGLPDLRGRVSVHPGNGPGLSTCKLGQRGGVENVRLTENEMPSHNHDVACVSSFGNAPTPAGNLPGAEAARRMDIWTTEDADGTMKASMISNSGGGQNHENRQPYLGVNYIIALQGVFPSRN